MLAIDLVDVRFGENKKIHRIVLEFSEKVTFKTKKNKNSIRLDFLSQIENLNSFKITNFPKNKKIIFNSKLNQINFKFEKEIELEKLFSIKKNVENENFRIVIDYEYKIYRKRKKIIIDAGHGGRDSGAVGVSKILEKNVTLEVAKMFLNRCKKEDYFICFLTRDGDYFMNLRERVKFARDKKGDIFISLHADFHPQKKVRGVSVYTLSEKASDKEAEALARRENKSDLIDGLDLSDETKEVRNILIDLTQRETMNRSSVFVGELVDEFKKNTKLLDRTHRFAGFAVLKAPDIPSVLLEMGYLSNRTDAKLLINKKYQEKIVENIYQAIVNYFNM